MTETETQTTEPTLELKESCNWSAHWRAASTAIYESADEALHHAIGSLDLDMTEDGVLLHCGEKPLGNFLLFTSVKVRGFPQCDPITFYLWPGLQGVVATCIGCTANPASHKPEDYDSTPWDCLLSWVLKASE